MSYTYPYVTSNNIYHGACHSCPHVGDPAVCYGCKAKNFENDKYYYGMSREGVLRSIKKKEQKEIIPKNSLQTFESIIMECQDIMNIETEVEKAYNRWSSIKNPVKIKKIDQKYIKIGFIFIIAGILQRLLISNNLIPIIFASVGFITFILPVIVSFISNISKTKPKAQPSESDKFEFLKSAYVGTISKLNERLDAVKSKIDKQINAHEKDREDIKQYSDILNNTDEALNKIESAIKDLLSSKLKVSDKKAEINKLLNEYIGENGYISQKESEIKRIKVAQELSDRMKNNFKTTMEITKSVDVLTDCIIPGIRQLMDFKIPELINKIEYECDKSRAFLEITN